MFVTIFLDMLKQFKQIKFTAVAMVGVLRRHRLKIPKTQLEIESKFKLSPQEIAQWMEFYQHHSPDEGKPAGDFPFFYFESVCALSFHKILTSLGVNFRHILNLETAFEFSPGFDSGNMLTTEYSVTTKLADLFEFDDKNRCVANIEVCIFKPKEEKPVLKINFNFLIKEVPEKDLKILRSIVNIKQAKRDFNFTSRPTPELGVNNKSFFKNSMLFSKNMGLEYGMISGDMNVVHTSWLMCKLFGIKKPFIQGLCIANYAVYKLGKREKGGLRNFKIQYCRPVFLDQTVEIRYNHETFEIIDSKNKILARGNFERYVPATTILKAA